MGKYKITLKRTDEFVETEWLEYIHSFNLVFKKTYSYDYFKHKYLGTSLGYSYHGILTCEDVIVGMFTIIPRKYNYVGKEITIGLGCDAFILKEHRKDEFFLKDMADIVIAKFNEFGITKFISIPNKSAYNYWLYYGGWKDIGELDYYIIPLNISKFIGKLSFLDCASNYTFKLTTLLSSLNPFISTENESKLFSLVRDEKYYQDRYNSDYTIIQIGELGRFVYRVSMEDNIRTAYIIDCYPKSTSTISFAIKEILGAENHKIDAIMFVGKIDKPPIYFLKVPNSKVPRIQHFIGLSVSNEFESDFFKLDSWDVSLSNFDNR